ncbi:ester hydrolase C11orf54 homolog [Convolutriloba macropyga]|uniref:ester hydrolase C11orf54 homolog n=1 Tax=Convolutriloba macropyga TaxID=536237 RepID=UPI003F51ADA2
MSFEQKLPVVVLDCFKVSLQSLKNALEEKLREHFKELDISIATSHDIQESNNVLPPVSLSSGGLAIDIGGMPYFIPTFNPHKQYLFSEIEELGKSISSDTEISLGIGGCCSSKRYAELLTYKNAQTGKLETYISSTADENKQPICSLVENNVFSCVGNIYASPSNCNEKNLLRIRVKRRISNTSFITAIRRAISQSFPNQIISLGGFFTVTNSRIHCHIASETPPAKPILDKQEFLNWLLYHNLDSPMTFGTVFHCHDPGLFLFSEHSHGTDRNRTKVAHYWHDLDEELVEYEAFLAVASKLVRIDMPPAEQFQFQMTHH